MLLPFKVGPIKEQKNSKRIPEGKVSGQFILPMDSDLSAQIGRIKKGKVYSTRDRTYQLGIVEEGLFYRTNI